MRLTLLNGTKCRIVKIPAHATMSLTKIVRWDGVLPGFNLLQHEQQSHWESGKFWVDLNQSDHGDGISYPTETVGGASSPMQTTSFLCISYIVQEREQFLTSLK